MALRHRSSNISPAPGITASLEPPRALVRFAWVGFVVFLAGYVVFQNVWLHLLWLLVTVLWPLALARKGRIGSGRVTAFVREPFLRMTAIFVGVMLLLSLRPGVPWPQWMPLRLLVAVGDGVLLLAFVGLAYRLGRRPPRMVWGALLLLVRFSGWAAVVSVVIFYGIMGREFPEARLENVLVHFGLAPVLTGFLFGFGALTAAVLASDRSCVDTAGRRTLLGWEAVLLLAALLTHSRGTVLALAAGFLVLVILHFRRAVVPPCLVLVIVAVTYQYLLPQMDVAWHRLTGPQETGAEVTPGDGDQGDPVVTTPATPPEKINPAASLVARKDAGRLVWYRLLLERMEGPWDVAFGRGRWADDQGPPRLAWAVHPHSVYLATYYRGGVVGAVVLAMVLGCGLWGGWRAARRGMVVWLVLAAFGCTALLFDGDDLTSMISLPRIEPLLWWFPLAAGAGAAALGSRSRNASLRSGGTR